MIDDIRDRHAPASGIPACTFMRLSLHAIDFVAVRPQVLVMGFEAMELFLRQFDLEVRLMDRVEIAYLPMLISIFRHGVRQVVQSRDVGEKVRFAGNPMRIHSGFRE